MLLVDLETNKGPTRVFLDPINYFNHACSANQEIASSVGLLRRVVRKMCVLRIKTYPLHQTYITSCRTVGSVQSDKRVRSPIVCLDLPALGIDNMQSPFRSKGDEDQAQAVFTCG